MRGLVRDNGTKSRFQVARTLFIQVYGVLASFCGLWSIFRAGFESESVLVSFESGSQPRKVPLLKAVLHHWSETISLFSDKDFDIGWSEETNVSAFRKLLFSDFLAAHMQVSI